MKWNKPCLKCGDKDATYHLMMVECDNCINNIPKEKDKYIKIGSLFMLNKDAA